jgi:putative peptidoglycan lipid II flippase
MVKRILKKSTNIFSWRQKNILSAAIVLMLMMSASSLLGLLRNRLLAGTFFSGQERLLDIYFAAFRLPDAIYQLLVLGGLSAAFIPVFSDYLQKNKTEAFRIASSVINIGMVVFLFLAVIVYSAAWPLCRLIAPGFNPVELGLMVQLTRLLLIAQGFFVISSLMTGIIQSFERFLLPALAAILYNAAIIFGILFLAEPFSIHGVVYGVIGGAFLHFIVQVPLVMKLGFKFSFSFLYRSLGVKKIFRLILPRMFSLFSTQINLSVAVFIASSLSAGVLALYSFTQNIIALPVSLFGLAIGQASLPALSREASNNESKFQQLFLESFKQILYLSLPASIVLIVLRIPVVRLVLGAKNFPWEATILTAKLVAVFAVSISAQSLIQLLIRYFYASQDTKTPLLVNVISVLVNIVLALVLVFYFDLNVIGLILANTIASIFHCLFLTWLIKARTNGWLSRQFVIYVAKIIFINFILAVVLWFFMRVFDMFLDTTKTINLILLTIATLAISLSLYTFLSWQFKLKEVYSLYRVLKRFGRWRQIFSQSEEILENPSVYD